MKYNSIILGIILVFMVSVTIAAAQETDHKGSELIPVTVEKQAPQIIITKADEHIISKVGQSYFSEFFEFVNSSSYSQGKDGSSYAVQYKYLIPENNFRTGVGTEQVIVRLSSNGDVVSYQGPLRAYEFVVTKERALSIARKNGMLSPTDAEIVYGGKGFRSDTGLITESYIWNVFSDSAEEGTPYVIYIDVDTEDMIGKLTQGSTEVVPFGQSGEEPPAETQTPSTDAETLSNKTAPSQEKQTDTRLLTLIVGAIIVLGVVGFFFVRRQRKTWNC